MLLLLRLMGLRRARARSVLQRQAKSACVPTSSMTMCARHNAGFTLLEVTIAAGLMSMCAIFAYATILAANRIAVSNRLFTLAQEIARDQVDRLQCATPYNPQITPAQIPADLVLGTTTKTTPLYIDPTTDSTVINATLTTVVTDLGSLNARGAIVTVQYNFRGRNYQVQMNTIRTSDS